MTNEIEEYKNIDISNPKTPEEVRQAQNKNFAAAEKLYIKDTLKSIYAEIIKNSQSGETNQYLRYYSSHKFSKATNSKVLVSLAKHGYVALYEDMPYCFPPYRIIVYWDKDNTQLINIDNKHKVLKGYWASLKSGISRLIVKNVNISFQSVTWERNPFTDVNDLATFDNILIANFNIKRWGGLLSDIKVTLYGNDISIINLPRKINANDTSALLKVQRKLYEYSQLFKEIVIDTKEV